MTVARKLIDVHITGGPNPWDYVIGASTLAAAALALIAIGYAAKAGRDLVHDRRQVFELGLLLDIYKQVEQHGATGGPVSVAGMYARLLPHDELPTFRAKLGEAQDRPFTEQEKDQFRSEMKAAVDRRTR